ncbi:MAG TPA: 3-hydroxybutyrate oligomer hydrolase family protein [Casimicrobiaceae bacterium]|nr:3-hydroxybutyrate oligomer hydrolase family protein [Casimicrobiaceae bacterium]
MIGDAGNSGQARRSLADSPHNAGPGAYARRHQEENGMDTQVKARAATLVALGAAMLLGGCLGGDSGEIDVNVLPAGVGSVTKATYDGGSDDLLTAGLGKTGLAAASAPAPANATAPTAAELRRLAIFNNYRAILDISPKGGYGTLYGPNIDVNGADTLGEGKVAGVEYLAYLDDGTGRRNVTLMVQVPAGWDRDKPCIVTATSSGSRGVYGAIGSAGEWGLKRKCAVAYTDKGTGTGFHDLSGNTITLRNGVRAAAGTSGSNFTAVLTDLAGFVASFPNRLAVKHAHSQQNPEKDWGNDTLAAVRFAIWVLNEEKGDKNADGSARRPFNKDNTIVIASSVSNGGGAAIAAAEQDAEGLIDGVAVAEPTLELTAPPGITVRQGLAVQPVARPLFDYYTLGNLYMACAALSPRAANSPGIAAVLPVPSIATNRCTALKARGLLTKATVQEQAEESVETLLAAGYLPESIPLFATHFTSGYPPVVATFANAYGRFSVADNLCGLSFAGTDATGKPAALAAATLAQSFGTSNGVPPTAGVALINNASVGGPVNTLVSVSPSTGVQDYNIDAAVCFRNLWIGGDANAQRVRTGVNETLRTGNLRGKPAIIVNGRADTQIPVNFNARPYYGFNKLVEGAQSRLSYIEVTNAQHFDAFIDSAFFPGYDSSYVPLHYYFVKAMDLMYAHLTAGAPLPPSQVVRTTPRGGTPGSAPAISSANVPPISASPATADLITFTNSTVIVPD